MLYDIDMDTCKKYDIEVENLPTEIELFDNDGTLCSKDEIESDSVVQDISCNVDALNLLFDSRLGKEENNVPKEDEPVYSDDNVAVALTQVVDYATEYLQTRLDYFIKVYVKDEETLERVCKVLDWRLPLLASKNQFNSGVNYFDVTLSDSEYKRFNKMFSYKLHIMLDGVRYVYNNSYSGITYDVILKPPFFDLPINTAFDYWTGPISSGKSLKGMTETLRVGLKNKSIIYLNK